MPVKEPKVLPEPFHQIACQRLRKFSRIRKDAETKKSRATKNRDEIQKAIDECNKHEVKRLEKLKADCFDEMAEIKRCNTIIAATDGRIIETIDKGDQAELFDSMSANPTVASLFEADDDEEDEANADDAE